LLIVLVCASNRLSRVSGPDFLRYRTITIEKKHSLDVRALALVV
jgi:hypothetical protein